MKKVVKFGGSSLADSAQFKKVGEIIKKDASRVYVVPSAPGKRFSGDTKVTDLLYMMYSKASKDEDFGEELDLIKERYNEIIEGLGLTGFSLEGEFAQIERRMHQSPDSNYAASRGEYLNGRIMARYLGYSFIDASDVIFFDENGALDAERTNEVLSKALAENPRAVIPGLYGRGANGHVKTFSRGGSDVTGSIVARAAKADVYENWTDVSGLYAADPRIVENPQTVSYMSYRELRTLSYMGASVLHSDAVLSASEMEIPINIRNTNRPEDAGTMVMRHLPPGVTKNPVTGVSGRKGMSVIQIEKVMVSDGSGFSALMLDILKERALPFEYCLTGIDSITLVIRSDLLAGCREELFEEIRETLHPDFLGVREQLSVIAVTGERATESSDANVRVLEKLTAEGIEIITINQGAGKLNLLIGVPEERYEDAIRAIYAFRQGRKKKEV